MLNMRTQLTSVFALLVIFLFGACEDSEDQSPEREGVSYTASYSDSEMIACQQSDDPCPAPFAEGVFCCDIATEPTCNCHPVGGAYSPSGVDGLRQGSPCGGVCDAGYERYRLERDEYGCVVAIGESGFNCFSPDLHEGVH